MQKNSIAFIFFFFALISACHKKAMNHSCNKNNIPVATNNVSSEIKNVIVDPTINMTDKGASYIIDSMKVKGDILSLFVNYSGGCKTHSFELFSDGAYAKSLPPQISICLKHNSNEDACRQLISQELKFNISKLKYTGQNTVLINLGNKQHVYYVSQ